VEDSIYVKLIMNDAEQDQCIRDNTTDRQRMTGYEEAEANARRCSSGLRREEISQPE